MKQVIFQIWQYLIYRWKAKDLHGVHSPFVYELSEKVLHDKKQYYAYSDAELVRKKLMAQDKVIALDDLGAGSNQTVTKTVALSHLVKAVSIPDKYGRLLFLLVNFVQPNTLLEMGTCIGLSSFYMGKARRSARHITLEGNKASAAIAEEVFNSNGLEHIEILVGSFDNTLALALSKLKSVDFAFVDGNHKYEPTLKYFEQILPYTSENSCLLFHDIHWSAEMHAAWQHIVNDPRSVLTIDLYFMGLVFFRKGIKKQHYVLKY